MTESTRLAGAESHLVATLASADRMLAGGAPVVAILTNSGVIPRSGPHRMNVRLARRLASMGIPSVRFDMSGLGDSRRAGGTLPVMEQWVADTRSIMDMAGQHFGCQRFVMVGFCSGAEVAHLVAMEDPRMVGMVLWDLYAYQTPRSRLNTFAYRLRRAGVGGAVRKVVARLTGTRTAPAKSSAQPSVVPPRQEFARRLQSFVDRNVDVLVAYCGGEREWYNYPRQFQDMFAGERFLADVQSAQLADSDHLMTRQSSQAAFTALVVHWLESRVLPRAMSRPPNVT